MSTFTTRRRLRELARPVLVAVVAGVAYGSWAALTHGHLGAEVALRAGCTQAALSMPTTLALVLVLERLFRLPSKPMHGFWLASVGTPTLAIVWLVVGHAFTGTPHIVVAIAPSVIVGTAFSFVYARTLLARIRRGS
ncbi:hypothetical protein [Mycobacterium decipiens]|uniref:Uncharacterized protein n=1 Tax=Mycobacterium decipiens TaxID=1430326 RepID=A0A1X2LSW3_9MYCO|nr:hypothetical protein [Mycobacterium decipiens]OSC39871.1 hypothetical protein B8W66_15355 [Mycobacterium decipiens]